MPSTKLAILIDAWYPRMQRFAVTLFILIAVLIVLLSKPADGDDLNSLAQNDPKDLGPAQPSCASNGVGFQPMPAWSRGAVMPPLPEVLKPMGKKVVVMTTPPTASANPNKETEPAPEVTVAKPKPAPVPAPVQSPALIAVSPFLQWIQSNPQAAAAQARQQANAYHTPETSNTGSSSATVTNPTANTPTGPVNDPYWLPPLIDSAPFGAAGGGSAAIYETPQR